MELTRMAFRHGSDSAGSGLLRDVPETGTGQINFLHQGREVKGGSD